VATEITAETAIHPRPCIHQSFVIRRLLNPIVVLFGRDPVLFVRGRRSGKRRAVPMDPPFEHEGTRYLVSPLGDGHWARNLRAAGAGELRIGRRRERFRAVELEGAERDAIVTAYATSITCGCRTYMRRLPNPADHPVFRLEPPGGADEVAGLGTSVARH
jgi:deazaflavin-dependent oxidoreductase (nitroreductase family)